MTFYNDISSKFIKLYYDNIAINYLSVRLFFKENCLITFNKNEGVGPQFYLNNFKNILQLGRINVNGFVAQPLGNNIIIFVSGQLNNPTTKTNFIEMFHLESINGNYVITNNIFNILN